MKMRNKRKQKGKGISEKEWGKNPIRKRKQIKEAEKLESKWDRDARERERERERERWERSLWRSRSILNSTQVNFLSNHLFYFCREKNFHAGPKSLRFPAAMAVVVSTGSAMQVELITSRIFKELEWPSARARRPRSQEHLMHAQQKLLTFCNGETIIRNAHSYKIQ